MPTQPESPFSPEDIKRVNEAIDLARTAVAQARLALRAEIEGAQDALERAQESERKMLKIKQVYFPNQ